MKVKTSFPAYVKALVWLLCLSLLFSATACGQKALPQYEAQPGVTYTQLMDDMNRRVMSGLADAIPYISWWGIVGGRVMAYGDDQASVAADRVHRLAYIDPENEDFNIIDLTLPAVSDDLPSLQAALAAEQVAAQQAGGTLTHDTEQEYDVPRRTVMSVLEAADEQVYLLLSDTLRRIGQDKAGYVTVEVTERAVTLCNLGAGGAVQPLVRLQIPQEYLLLSDVAEDSFLAADGSLWLTATDYLGGQAHLLRFSPEDGRLLSSLSLPEGVVFWSGSLTLLDGDRLLVPISLLDNTATVSTYLPQPQFYLAEGLAGDAPVWRDPIDLPVTMQQGFSSMASVLRLDETQKKTDGTPKTDTSHTDPLFYTPQGVFRYDLEGGEAQQLLDWTEFAIQPAELGAVVALPEGRWLVATQPAGQTYSVLQVLTPLDPAVIAERTILTFGKLSFGGNVSQDPIQEMIARFNATSDEYYIQTIDYDQLAQQQGLGIGNGDTSLNMAVINGEVPDILMFAASASLDTSLLHKGLTIDLYPYIDADPDLSREDFLPNILAMSEVGDTLPSVFASYDITTLIGSDAVVGQQPGWILQDYQALCQATGNDTPVFRSDRDNFLGFLLRYAEGLFYDRETRQAYFDNGTFAALLQSSAAYPAQIDYNSDIDPMPALADGSALLVENRLRNWEDVSGGVYVFGDQMVYKGYPSDGSNNGAAIVPWLWLGISSSCQHPDAAWQLVRQFLLPDFQDLLATDYTYHGFPLRQDSLQTSAQTSLKAMEEIGGGMPFAFISRSVPHFTEDMRVPVAQQDLDKLLDLIQQATLCASFSGEIGDIVTEEADAFYNGVRTAEEAAAIVQDRVQTYLNEQG